MVWLSFVLFLVALVVGAGLVWLVARSQLGRARSDGQRILNAARKDLETLQAEHRVRLETLQKELDTEAQTELEAQERENDDYCSELEEREKVLQLREDDLTELKDEVGAKEKAALDNKDETERLHREQENVLNKMQAKLEEIGELSTADAIEQIVRDRVEKASHQGQIRLRNIEEQTKEDAATEATRLMATVVDRYAGVGHLERVQNTIPVPDKRTLLSFVGVDSPAHAAFIEETNCELVCDEEAGVATVRGDDPLAREIARRVLRQIANRSIRVPERIRVVSHQVKGEIEREVQNAGRRAIRMIGLKKVHPEILHLVGRLKFRLSYSQNQLKHAIEVAFISGMLAEELGVDVALARRGGLLHDIGKAMTHEREGSHAVLGAEVARRCGEIELVANAIGAHHNDEPAESAIAHIVTAADALSGARPGARRESVTAYVNRIQDIQAIASRSAVVRRVDVMHAGREVRVIVAGEDRGEVDDAERNYGPVLTDAELHPLAQDIARDLEAEVGFAGQIRVTVIRESRAVSIAY